MRCKRGGNTLKTGKIGRVNVLRQQYMMAGERMNASISGSVRLETLRERDVMRINAHLATFFTPLRWVWTDFPQYLREGPDTAVSPPVITNEENWEKYGVGSWQSAGQGSMYQWFRDVPLRIYNEWYKWPESNDETNWPDKGQKAVPLSKPWSRCRFDATPDDTADYQVGTAGNVFDVRDLAEIQARFRGSMKRDVLTFNRWIEIMKESYNANGSREVDQVPIMLDQVDVGVSPREMPATDGASLGTWQSMYDFNVNHQIRGITAPEHGVLTYMLVIRFAPIIEGCMPLATDRLDWFELCGDPEWLTVAKPVEVQRRDLMQSNSSEVFGFLPAGWQWRCDHDVIGEPVDTRDTFPYMQIPTLQAEAKDATRVKPAFRSQALDDYMVDLYFDESCYQPVGDTLESYFSGMLDDARPGMRKSGDEFPKGGKSL